MIVCADDYGFRDDVNRAIVELAGCGKLSAISCLVALERCSSHTLAELPRSVLDVGLHLCLTDEGLTLSSPLGGAGALRAFPSYRTLLGRSFTGQLRRSDVRQQISAQYELFVSKSGRAPDFIDGHLHVHQLPGIREPLLEFVLDLPVDGRPYIRNTRALMRDLWDRRLPCVKSGLIGAFGSRMARDLKAAGLETNTGFAGVYDFRRWRRFPEYLPGFVDCLPDRRGLLVVHPGMDENWRHEELVTLRQFPFRGGTPNRFRA